MKADTLDKTVAFLAKRDGIDKTLKILRYAGRLALATTSFEGNTRLQSFESSIGTSRKAYRLGKFLQNVNNARKIPLLAHPHSTLELFANAGECIYYFVEQFQWLVKAGVLPPSLAPQLTRISASGELIGYTASIALTVLRLHFLLEKEIALIKELQRRRRARASNVTEAQQQDEMKDDVLIISEIRQLRSRRALRTLGLAQDICDSFLAIADLRDLRGGSRPSGLFNSRSMLAMAGLISGSISAYKNWPGVNT